MILKTVRLFEENKDILEKVSRTLKYIHVDEYQDTNTVQYLLTKTSRKKYKIFAWLVIQIKIFTVGGADITNILNFEEDYPGAEVVLLEQNYRSTKNIIEVANNIIKNKQRKIKFVYRKRRW